MMSQLNFLQSFVSDLLDLRNISDNILTMNPEPFDPILILAEVCNIF